MAYSFSGTFRVQALFGMQDRDRHRPVFGADYNANKQWRAPSVRSWIDILGSNGIFNSERPVGANLAKHILWSRANFISQQYLVLLFY